MTDITMGAVESRFARLIWDNEPITAAELARPGAEMEEDHRLHGPEAAV